MLWFCIPCHQEMSLNSRANHINDSAASLKAIYNETLFADCPFPDCRTKHLCRGLKTHITKKHPGYLIPHPPPPLPNIYTPAPPPGQSVHIPPLPLQAPLIPPHPHPLIIPAAFLAVVGDIVDGGLYMLRLQQKQMPSRTSQQQQQQQQQ
jgi:hypothetical protein